MSNGGVIGKRAGGVPPSGSSNTLH